MNNELCNKYNLFILKTSIYVIWKWKFITEEGRTHVTIGVSGGEHTQSRYLQGIHGGGGNIYVHSFSNPTFSSTLATNLKQSTQSVTVTWKQAQS